MKINTKQPLLALDGTSLTNSDKQVVTVGESLSNIVLGAKRGGKMKLFVLAQNLYKEPEVELDAADLKMVIEEVEKTDVYNNIVAGQLLVLLSGTK